MSKAAADKVARLLRERIEEGYYRPGGRLPSQAEIADTLGVGGRAVLFAMRTLKDSGHVETRIYRGHYVRPREDWRAP